MVSTEEHKQICNNAQKMNWEVKVGERRTFISTPYGFKIELQTNIDVIDSMTDNVKIKELKMVTKIKGLENDLSLLFSKPIENISSVVGDSVTIKKAKIKGLLQPNKFDPNGVKILESLNK